MTSISSPSRIYPTTSVYLFPLLRPLNDKSIKRLLNLPCSGERNIIEKIALSALTLRRATFDKDGDPTVDVSVAILPLSSFHYLRCQFNMQIVLYASVMVHPEFFYNRIN